jgi:hypothetical protein
LGAASAMASSGFCCILSIRAVLTEPPLAA